MSRVLKDLNRKYAHQPKFLQAVTEISKALEGLLTEPRYEKAFRTMVEPERAISFKVLWEDDQKNIQVNRGWRVQFNSAIGPYKGGLRFHPSVDEGTVKFLGFEQIFKNALTGLPMGGGKGGSDFDPKGKSDAEVRRFCQAFMGELHRHIGPDTDVPAGDIGVGGREIGFMYGAYKRLTNTTVGVLTGKGELWGGSRIRPEATGYGAVYIARSALQHKGDVLAGKRCIVSGSGNVAQYCAEKLLQLGAHPITFSDSGGTLFKKSGFTDEDLKRVMSWKNETRGRLQNLEIEGTEFHPCQPWGLEAIESVDLAFPCATENEINAVSAQALVDRGCVGCFEGANMPVNMEGQSVLKPRMIYIPGKAANAGGVAVSGLEMSQNSLRDRWTREQVDQRLEGIMTDIYAQARKHGGDDLEKGATIAGFLKVAHAMEQMGMC